MNATETALPGVYIIEPKIFEDHRGFFFENYNQDKLAKIGIRNYFVQDNHSKSIKGTLRGLHYQLKYPQAKLCRVIQGEVLDVAVDIRSGSPTFGRWLSLVLSARNKRQIYIPRGFAHGFLVLSDTAEFLYKCDEFYHPEDEHGIRWNDPVLNINWGTTAPPLPDTPTSIISKKDQGFLSLKDIPIEQIPLFT